MECFGATSMPENQADETSSQYADDGTASHTLAAWCFDNNKDTVDYPADHILVNGKRFDVDDERRDRIQIYVDDVRRSAMGGTLWSEHRIDLSKYLGMAVCPTCEGTGRLQLAVCPTCRGEGEVPQGGTSDAVIIQNLTDTLIVSDLKDGAGERVWASYPSEVGSGRRINHQIGLYALGVLEDALMLGYTIKHVIVRIYQPRLHHIDEFTISVEDLLGDFASRVVAAAAANGAALIMPVGELDAAGMLTPGPKQCRWCRATVRCPAYKRMITEVSRANFEDESQGELPVPEDTTYLAQAYAKAPMIAAWLKAVTIAVNKAVADGKQVMGPDHQPLKFVDGGEGNRAWDPSKLLSGEVEALLAGQLGPKAYEPHKPITAPAAMKLLNKKATKKLWEDIFQPMVKRPRKPPVLAWGSDSRPAVTGGAEASEFEDEDIGVTE